MKIRRSVDIFVFISGWPVIALIVCQDASAQICKPVSQRTSELGCWIMADVAIGQLPEQPIFWHLDTYPTRAAAEAAKGPHGTVTALLGKVWLLTIDVAGGRPSGGDRVAEIGPLPVSPETSYSAQYMEAIFTPGMTAPSHRHSRSEAWYTMAGETCLETPDGKMVRRAIRQGGNIFSKTINYSHNFFSLTFPY